jgi:DNA-binding NarL/FixJ family response regulator
MYRQRLREAARTSLGDDEFARVWVVGRALTPEEVVASLDLTRSPLAPDVTAPATESAPLPADLTPREYDVLLLVNEGLSNAEIARRLVISVATVKTHLAAVYRKLGVSSRLAAMRYVVDHRLR